MLMEYEKFKMLVDEIKDTIVDWRVKQTRQLHWTKTSGLAPVKVVADALEPLSS